MLIQATRVQALQPGQRRLQESNKLNVSPCILEFNVEPHCVKQTIARRGWLAKVARTVRLSHLVHPSAAVVRVASKNKSEMIKNIIYLPPVTKPVSKSIRTETLNPRCVS
jgi:hypothetical protein